jgi:quaternary ammonium compound-resistance protein SugE
LQTERFKGWTFLLLAGASEVVWSTSLRYEGPLAVATFVATMIASLLLLKRAMRTIPLSTCYAAFTGLGAAGTALVGIAAFGEPLTFVRCALLAIVVGAVAALKYCDN